MTGVGVYGCGEVYGMVGGVMEAPPHGFLTKKKDICMPPLVLVSRGVDGGPCGGGWR